MKGLLLSIIRTLNLVEVRGEENLEKLLACIQTLQKLVDAGKEETKEETVDANQDQQGAQV